MTARVALVTGASRNIGRSIVLALAADGMDVAINCRRPDDADAASLADAVRSLGRTPLLVPADVTNSQAVDSMVSTVVDAFGRLDTLVHNAAIRRKSRLVEISNGEWRQVTATILDAAFYCGRAAVPHLLASGAGRLIAIGGVSGHLGAANRAHVVAAKAGLAGLVKALAQEFAERGLTVNCVVPGPIATTRTAETGSPPGFRPPVGYEGAPDDIARGVAFLNRPESGFITGQSIHVNGGTYMP